MERFSKLVKNVFGIDISNIFVIIAAVAVLLIVIYFLAVLVYYLVNMNSFKKRIRNLNVEIGRNQGSTRARLERIRKRIYKDLFLFRL